MPRKPPDRPEAETVIDPEWAARPESQVVVEETAVRPPRRRGPLLWPWLLALLLLVLGGLGGAYALTREDEEGAATTTTASAGATVPVLVGLREDAARGRVREAGLVPQVERRESAKPRGVVFEQQPEPGAERERGEDVRLVVSTGPPREAVPDVVGRPFEEARRDLEAAGLRVARREAFGDAEPGTVLEQEPSGGARLREGALVTLTVSKGREPARVPEVVGMASSAAAADIRDAGFEVTLVPVPSDQPPGTVVAQSPSAGTEAPKGSAVRLNVAQQTGGATQPTGTTTQAQPVSVPEVVGQELADAVRAFAEEGLKVAVAYVPSTEPQGRVVAQAQPAGTERRRGDTVQVNVSVGPEPAPRAAVPRVTGIRQDQARQQLVAAGFEVLVVNLQGDVRREDRVASQTPAGGASIPRGSLVILYVVTEA